ncbi:hypothetical protein PSEUBRA_005092 [Kalmanozyma brasiliensis GHG001]|uniref:uncharacterized protein n=1 Tax=Kalmanozyma brasiliensis (strain GHG001) TaxID=1365824 RepID=UPI0028681280|nr:uncharacterized protein PSEUBRA_005092 [Kalmanozyma brasiliensis GHG001]KAF6767477.1 hypothetical protein PSEUBRA_005092 [Kalmanozyma brasiliensis GHG001]
MTLARIIPGLLIVLLVMRNLAVAWPMNRNGGGHDPFEPPTHDLVSGPSQLVAPNSPGTSSPSWSPSFSPSDRPLDATDHEILQSLSADLTAGSSKKRGRGKTLMDRETKRRSRFASARLASGWPEPPTLARLDEVPPLRHLVGRGELAYVSDNSVRDRIVNGLFAGKLRWVDKREMPTGFDPRAYHKRSPYMNPSRVLPLPNTGAEGLTHVHMTQHNMPIRKGGVLVGSVLEGKPYYAFWGVAQHEVKDKVPVTFYGAGWFDGMHVDEVDAHLGSLLEHMKRGVAR